MHTGFYYYATLTWLWIGLFYVGVIAFFLGFKTYRFWDWVFQWRDDMWGVAYFLTLFTACVASAGVCTGFGYFIYQITN